MQIKNSTGFGMILIFLMSAVGSSCQSKKSSLEYCPCQTWSEWRDQEGVTCGYVTVPENHNQPEGRKIKVAFAIFKGNDKANSKIPTLILTGGPGGRALETPLRGFNHESRALGDVIVVEQRGIGLSDALPDISMDILSIIARDLDTEEEKAAMQMAMEAKAAEIKAAGIDATQYNSTQNAMDFGVLMDELGYEKYNLYGTSYGTKLGMTIMKYFPGKVNAAILDGPATLANNALESRFPDLKRALSLLFEKCQQDLNCSTTHPNLKAEMIKAFQSLRENPIRVQLLDREFVINPQDALFFIRYLLYRSTAFETVPAFIIAINDRDIDTIAKLGEFPAKMLTIANTSTFYSFNLYEEFSDETADNVNDFMNENDEFSEGLAWFQSFIPALADWHTGRAGEAEKELNDIAVPTLIIVNDFDPATPPHNTALFEKSLTNEQVLRLNQFGHGAGGNCISSIRISFLANPNASINADCLNEK